MKLCLELGARVSIHPLLTGLSDDFHALNVYLTGNMAQPAEVKGRLWIVFSGL